MAKVLFVCKRYPCNIQDETETLRRICHRIAPDQLQPNHPIISNNNGISIGVFNPSKPLLLEQNSVCLGTIIGNEGNWYQPKGNIPDGSYALFRSNDKYVELVTDILGSRTIWYYHSDELFIASTSQRMIITYLRKFKPEKKAYPWVLATGMLGSFLSWDKRIKCLPADAKIILDRETWKTRIDIHSPRFETYPYSYAEHRERLTTAITETFNNLQLDFSKWIITLSGGVDSRAILLLLKQHNVKTITWGVPSSIQTKDSDAYIAKLVANHCGCSNQYYHLNISANESLELIFDRFLKIGEGRIDHISGYLDGFSIWNKLFEDGVSGIIRGDQSIGRPLYNIESKVMSENGIRFLTEHDKSDSLLKGVKMESNVLPAHLKRQKGETLPWWDYRLHNQYKISHMVAALSDLKLSHVEIANPFLSKKIISIMRTLPDELRNDKRLFKDIVHSLSPPIGYAKQASVINRKRFFKMKSVVAVIKDGIKHSEVLEEKLISNIMKNMLIENPNQVSRKQPNPDTVFNTWGFRAYMITKMHKILEEDAAFLDRK